MNTLTKTEITLLKRDRYHGKTYVQGKREVDAAKKLVAKGLVKEFKDYSGLSRGEYYIHPFTRRAGISKTIFVYGGDLFF
jgi:hypothetical protein